MSIASLRNSTLPDSLYEATVQRNTFAALGNNVDCDVCVVGGGMAGLHTALQLAESGARVVLLEGRRIGWGASGRNGGHLIPEFACGMRKLESALGEVGAQRAWRIAHDAADALRVTMARYGIDCEYQGGHLEVAITQRHVDALHAWHEHARQRYGAHYRAFARDDMPSVVGSQRYIAGLLDEQGGHLHPLKLTLGLARVLRGLGGAVHENTRVLDWQPRGDRVEVRCTVGIGRTERIVRASRVVLAANVDIADIKTRTARKLAARVLPVGTWIIATEPLPAALAAELLPTRAAVCDTRVVLDYYRLDRDNRMVFGGGCDYLGRATPQGFAQSLRAQMLKVFPQLENTRIEHAWGGLIDISMKRMPDVGRDDSGRIYYAQGFSGSGIVATAAIGGVVARALGGDDADLRLFSGIRQNAFPGGDWLRGPITAAGMLWYRMLDAL